MMQTLFTIPDVFGFGWLLAVWAVAAVAIIAWSVRRHGWTAETRGNMIALGIVGLAIALVIPALIQPDGLPIRGYGVMFVIAFVSGVALSAYRARQKGVDPELILSLAMWLFFSGIVGARVFYVVEYWDQFQRPTLPATIWAVVNLTEGGLVVFGSMLVGGAALVVFIYKYKLPGLALADLIAPGVVLGAAVGRVGCLLNGCCYGAISDVAWAVPFPPGSPVYLDQAQRGELYIHGLKFKGSGATPAVIEAVEPGSPAAQARLAAGQRVTGINGVPVDSVSAAQLELLRWFGEGTRLRIRVAGDNHPATWTITGPRPASRPTHPTQVYDFIAGMLLCFFLLAYEPYRRRDGELTALVLTIHPVLRYLLEDLRVDELPALGTGFTIAQIISIALFVAGIGLWIYLSRRPAGCAWSPRLAMAGS